VKNAYWPLGLTIMIGLIVAGFFIGEGIKYIKPANRYVTVKGFAEKTVRADMASWNITYVSQASSFEQAIAKNKSDQDMLIQYLKNAGLKDTEIEIGTPRVQENVTNKTNYFVVEHSIMILTKDVGLVKKIGSRSSEILQLGIALSGWNEPTYFYNGLNSIKPGMIADAIKNAREAAEKFAQDSQSKVGKIKFASQGIFSFSGVAPALEESYQIEKVARVVITIDYFLSD
jgi:uncharacterized protein